jgi:hypothetical protein
VALSKISKGVRVRSKSNSSAEANKEAGKERVSTAVDAVKPKPAWRVVEASPEKYYGREIIESVLSAIGRLVQIETDSLSKKVS